MKNSYAISGGKLVSAQSDDAKVHVFVLEENTEREEIIKTLNIDNFDIEATLDPDEISRIEFKPGVFSIIWKRPYRVSGDNFSFGVSSTGLFFHKNELSIIIGKENSNLFAKEELKYVNNTIDVLLKYFFYTIRKYLAHLKEIKKTTNELESKISSSLGNKTFLQMFDLSESLIYYINAIEANGSVLIKLRESIGKIKGAEFSLKQIELLDDIILENKQCARQAQIYSNVLSGLMDARGNVINNNMNTLLKNLTLINVIFLPLNLIASIGGMSEFTFMSEHFNLDWKISYPLLILFMSICGYVFWLFIKKFIEHNSSNSLGK